MQGTQHVPRGTPGACCTRSTACRKAARSSASDMRLAGEEHPATARKPVLPALRPGVPAFARAASERWLVQVVLCSQQLFARAESSKGQGRGRQESNPPLSPPSFLEQAGPLMRCVTRAKTPLRGASEVKARRVGPG